MLFKSIDGRPHGRDVLTRNSSLAFLFVSAGEDELSWVHLGEVLRRFESNPRVSAHYDYSLTFEVDRGDWRDLCALVLDDAPY